MTVPTVNNLPAATHGVEDGMPGRNVQRKPGTSRGSPRRSRTAKASRISAMRRNRDAPASGADGVD
jgi:hypothetical protein